MQSKRFLSFCYFLPWFTCFAFVPCFAQTGPGGVGNSTTNKLWLDASKITGMSDGAKVSNWTDLSGNNNHATQTNATYQPIYKANLINSLPGIKFHLGPYLTTIGHQDNASITMIAVASVDGLPSAFSLDRNDKRNYLVSTPGNEGHQNYACLVPHQIPYFHNFYIGKIYQGVTGYNAVNGIQRPTGSFSILFGIHNANTNSGHATINGNRGPVASGTRTAGGEGFKITIGRRGDGYSSTNSTIAEVIVYNTALNDAQRIIVENYLAEKYKLSIAHDFFTPPSSSYHFDVQGIGTVDGVAKHNQAENSQGLGLEAINHSLDKPNEFLFAAHASQVNGWETVHLSTANIQRWKRDWYVEKTGSIDATLTFDSQQAGVTPEREDVTYCLLYQATPSSPLEIVLSSEKPIQPVMVRKQGKVTFLLPDALLKTGYYTLGKLSKSEEMMLAKLQK